MYATRPRTDHATSHLVCAAITAPSLHNSQPWLFTGRAGGLDLYADLTRRLPLADPVGREMAISCGGALFNVRLAMRHLGFQPVVRPFPDPWSPAFVARVAWGPYDGPSDGEELIHHAMRQRHTWHGPFRAAPLPEALVDELREHARAEGTELYALGLRGEERGLAELVREAERAHRADPAHVTEVNRWTRATHSGRLDGVPFDVNPWHPDCTSLAGRDFLGLTRMMPDPPEVWPTRTGAVVVLTTSRDTHRDWLRAGQALQRVLLYAAAHRVSAAFHTQPLEIPQLRTQIRRTVTAGQYPQMILRLGFAGPGRPTPRRPVAEVLAAD